MQTCFLGHSFFKTELPYKLNLCQVSVFQLLGACEADLSFCPGSSWLGLCSCPCLWMWREAGCLHHSLPPPDSPPQHLPLAFSLANRLRAEVPIYSPTALCLSSPFPVHLLWAPLSTEDLQCQDTCLCQILVFTPYSSIGCIG